MAGKKQSIEEVDAVTLSGVKRLEKQENTRSHIANVFIWGYLLLLFMLILMSAVNELPQDSAKDYLLAIGSPLGFIIGFYFKGENHH